MSTGPWTRRLALPLLLLLGLAGWSGYWLYAQARVAQEIERGAERLQARGGEFVCRDRQWQGFPLRIVLGCGSLRLAVPGGPQVETARLEAWGHLHDPRRITAHTDRIVVEGAPDWTIEGRNIAIAADSDEPDHLRFSASGEALSFADRSCRRSPSTRSRSKDRSRACRAADRAIWGSCSRRPPGSDRGSPSTGSRLKWPTSSLPHRARSS